MKMFKIVVLIYLGFLFCFGLNSCSSNSRNKKIINAYCISNNEPYDRNEMSLFMYIFKDKPYLLSIDDNKTTYSSQYKLSIDLNKPSKYTKIRLLREKIENSVIFYGFNFQKNDFLEIKSNDTFISKIKIDSDFATKLNLKNNYSVYLYRDNTLNSSYIFNFTPSSKSTFFPIEITPPLKKVIKTINFDTNGDFELVTK